MRISSYSCGGKWVKLVRVREEYEGSNAIVKIRKTDICLYSHGQVTSTYTAQVLPFERKHDFKGYRATFTLRGGYEIKVEFEKFGEYAVFAEDMEEGMRK